MACTFLRISVGGISRTVRGRAMFSSRVRVSSRLNSWNTKPRASLRKAAMSAAGMAVMSLPSSRMRPELTVSMVEMQFKRVVLPEPEAPMTAIYSPAWTRKPIWSRALVTAWGEP